MFDSHISGEVPEHRDFIYGTAIPALERMGVKIRILRGLQTYVGLFTGRITRGPKKGLLRSFPICGRCAVQRDCKLKPILRYQKSLPPDTVQYIGIARDEQERLLRLDGRRVSLLDKYGKGDIFLYLATERGADVDESWAILPALRHTIPEHSQVLAHSLPHGGIVRRGWAEGIPFRFPAIFPDMR